MTKSTSNATSKAKLPTKKWTRKTAGDRHFGFGKMPVRVEVKTPDGTAIEEFSFNNTVNDNNTFACIEAFIGHRLRESGHEFEWVWLGTSGKMPPNPAAEHEVELIWIKE